MKDPADFWMLPGIQELIEAISRFYDWNPDLDKKEISEVYLQKKVDAYLELNKKQIGVGDSIRTLFTVCIQSQVALSTASQRSTLHPNPVSPSASQSTGSIQQPPDRPHAKIPDGNNMSNQQALTDQKQGKPDFTLPLDQESKEAPRIESNHCFTHGDIRPKRRRRLTESRVDATPNANVAAEPETNEQHQERLKKQLKNKISLKIFHLLLKHGSLSRCQLAALLGACDTDPHFNLGLRELRNEAQLVVQDPKKGRFLMFSLSDKAFLNPNDRPEPDRLDAETLAKLQDQGLADCYKKRKQPDAREGCSRVPGSNKKANQVAAPLPSSGQNRQQVGHAMLGSVQVGSRLEVYWPADQCYYPGTITSRRANAMHPFLLEYDDGDIEWIDPGEEDFRMINEESPAVPAGIQITEQAASDVAGNAGESLDFFLPGEIRGDFGVN